MTSYDMFIKTIETLSHSQCYYSRLYKEILSLSDNEKQELQDRINTTKDFKSSLDVILELEQ